MKPAPAPENELLIRALSPHLGTSDTITLTPFSHGHINTLWEVKSGTKTMLLRAFNEPWKAKKKEYVYRLIKSHTDIPVPDILVVDDSLEHAPFAFSLMSKMPGMTIDKVPDAHSLFRDAGKMLAQLHTITFPSFGWIIAEEISPSFPTWREFAEYDIALKIEKVRHHIPTVAAKLGAFFQEHIHLLDLSTPPCLVHKDYHASHILTDGKKITGIIDVEWAIAGHHENDFTKINLLNFAQHPE